MLLSSCANRASATCSLPSCGSPDASRVPNGGVPHKACMGSQFKGRRGHDHLALGAGQGPRAGGPQSFRRDDPQAQARRVRVKTLLWEVASVSDRLECWTRHSDGHPHRRDIRPQMCSESPCGPLTQPCTSVKDVGDQGLEANQRLCSSAVQGHRAPGPRPWPCPPASGHHSLPPLPRPAPPTAGTAGATALSQQEGKEQRTAL